MRTNAETQPRRGEPEKTEPLRDEVAELEPEHERVNERPLLRVEKGEKDVERVEPEAWELREPAQLDRQHKALVPQEPEP